MGYERNRRNNMRVYGVTDVGRNRNTNQDYIFYSEQPVGIFPNLYIVADGMGGHKAGDYASSYCVKRFVELASEIKEPHIVLLMGKIIEQVNEEIYEIAKKDENFAGMGTTIVAAVIEENTMYVMNIGDSRLYVIGEEIVQITMDHSYVEELIRNGLDKELVKNHPEKHKITRAVGAEKKVKPDFFEVSLSENDKILLCSDGLTNMVDDDEIMEIVQEEKTTENIVNRLVTRANFYGGRDNISAIIMEQGSEVTVC